MERCNLYFVTDREFPEFPLRALSADFVVIRVARPTLDVNWFDWGRSGCLVCETANPDFAISTVEALRSSWINMPTILYAASAGEVQVASSPVSEGGRGGTLAERTGFSPPSQISDSSSQWSKLASRTCQFAFSRTFECGEDISAVRGEMQVALEHDKAGSPSPLEIRQRFGRLANQERRVLDMSLQGKSSKEIARILNIRYQTVDKYRRNALHRMKAKNLILLLRQLFASMYRNPPSS